MAGAISLTHWISSKMTSRLRARAVAAISRVSMTAPAASTFAMIAKRRRPSDHLAQKLKTLAGRIGLLERQSGEVAARTRQANDDTGADRIHLRGKDDRDNLRGPRLAARTGAEAHVTMTSTLSLTSSAAISA
jgi:hypothetical protein